MNKLLGHFPMVCVKVTHKLTAVVQMICVNVCVAQNNAFHPVIVNDQKHCLFFFDDERDAVTTFLPGMQKISYSGGVRAFNGYAVLQELNNEGVHSQSS